MTLVASVYEARYIPRNLAERSSAFPIAQTYSQSGHVLVCTGGASLLFHATNGEPAGSWKGNKEGRLEAITESAKLTMGQGENEIKIISPPSEYDETLRYAKEGLPDRIVRGFAPKFKDHLDGMVKRLEYKVIPMKGVNTGANYLERTAKFALNGGSDRYVILCSKEGAFIFDTHEYKKEKAAEGPLHTCLGQSIAKYERLSPNGSKRIIMVPPNEYEEVLKQVADWIIVIDGNNVLIEVERNIEPQVTMVPLHRPADSSPPIVDAPDIDQINYKKPINWSNTDERQIVWSKYPWQR